MTRIAIIGAGITGLTIANLLHGHAEITLFEKSRGVSGRLSTRRADPFSFDHGAQYFRIKTPAFRQFMSPLIQDGIVAHWDAHFVEIKEGQLISKQKWTKDGTKLTRHSTAR